MKRTTILITTTIAGIAFLAGYAVSEEAGTDAREEKKEMVEMMAAKGQPTEAHKRLEAMVGEFETTLAMTMGPGAPSMTARSTAKGRWVLGGRFIEMTTEPAPDEEFRMSSISYFGYDARIGKYFWWGIDSSDTYSVFAEGEYDEATKSLVLYGENFEPDLGGKVPFRTTIGLGGPAAYTLDVAFEMPEAYRAQMPEGTLDADGFMDVMTSSAAKKN